MAEEKVTNGEIPHLAELSDDRLVSFKKERLLYKADLEAANRNKTGNARTIMRTVAQCIDANLLNEIKEELQLPENISEVKNIFREEFVE